MDRTENVTKNLKFTMTGEIILAVLKFVSRRMFLFFLGKEYLGVNGLFTDILSVLSLAELGFGVSITYSLYYPAAHNDTELIKSLMQLYHRFYRIVSVIVLLAGLSLTPFLGFFIREMPENVPNLSFIYILNVVNVSVSYLFAYTSTLLFVCQKKYIDAMIRAAVTLLSTVIQIIVLYLTGSYIAYLCISIGAVLLQNIAVSAKADSLYPYLREKDIRPLPDNIMLDIRRNVNAMILHRIGTVAVFSTDNILISKFVGVVTAGLYSNYMMVRGFLTIVVNALFNTFTPAMGNLNATETKERNHMAFRQLNFFAAWLFGWVSICLLFLYNPFIDIWLGRGYLLPDMVVFLIVVNFYVNSMRIPVTNTRSAMGLFRDNRFRSLIEALINLTVSVILAGKWGITGVIAGTIISTLALPFWIEPLGLYRYGLKRPCGKYFLHYFVHLLITAAAGTLTGILCQLAGETFFGLLLKIVYCTVIPNLIYILVYHRTNEFLFLKNTAGHIAGRLIRKFYS